MNFIYLFFLIFSLIGLGVLDYRRKLVLYSVDKNSLVSGMLLTITIFLIIDVIGVFLNIFSSNLQYIAGIYVLPGVPLEEVFFLTLFAYVTTVLWRLFK